MAKTTRNRKGEVDLEVSALEHGMKVPQAPEVEASVLGAMMLDQDIVEELMTVLQEDCFYKPENRMIFKAVRRTGSRPEAGRNSAKSKSMHPLF